jgi:[protein-PII] uridylyltransferase
VRRVAEGISYPLWDAGFELGLVVRTPQECAEAATERLDSLTAMLDARILAGPEELLRDATVPVRRIAAGDVPGFARRLRAAAVARRERFGSTAHLLEPDLKEGGGGLRDVASLGWLQAAVGSPLEDAGLLRTWEGAAVDAAEGFLLRVRSAVHLETGRRADRLVMELQPAVAAEMGFVDEPGLPAADGLMRAVFEHARNVELVHDLALDRVLDEGDAPTVPDLAGPAQVLRALGELAEVGAVPSSALLDAVEAADVPDPVVWTPEVRDAFVGLLREGPAGAGMLDVLDRIGLLVRFLPAWDAVRCRPQRDPYHRFTVDAHLLAAASGIAELLAGPADADDPLQTEAAGTIERPDGVLLGALLHDIGKVGQGNHAAIGAGIAERQLRTMALEAADRDLAAFIVAEHLVLPDTATRRDLTDENLVLDVAARVGTPERLAALYLLAKADARATGPAAWTPWRQALIRELVGKVQRAFERGEMGAELAATLAERVDRLRELLAAEPDDLVDRFVLRMPRGYFLAVGPDRAARHLPVVMPDLGANEVRTASHATGAAGTHELLVVANDRPGLLSWIAGSLALGGISILSAQAFTTEDGVAVDLFEVEGAFEPEIDERRWRAFRSSLRRAIDGSASLERRVEEQRGAYPAHRAPAPITVTVDNEASEFSTVLEVGAPDRIGLLYDITRTFADLRLDVHLAKVTTFEGRVVDAFYLRDALGRKVTDPRQLDEVHEALRERLG